ncbi:MAG: helix-turn-helix transcriptional regulator, partial [Solirubrobacteraceae bacterium]
GANTRAQITRRVLTPEVSFDDLSYSFDIGYSGEVPGRMIICEVVSNTIRRVGEGCDETFGPGDLFLISRPELPYGGVAHASRLRFTVLDPAIFNRVVTADDAQGRVRELDHRPVSRQAARQLQRAIAYVRGTVLGAPEASHSPLVLAAAGQYLAASVLHAFPNTAVTNRPVENDVHVNSGTLRRAVAFIDANPDLDISLTDIARAACATPRTLQLAFRRHLDTTPMAYLRRLRLDHAHQQLLDSGPDDQTTVAHIAANWGFGNPSCFARHYQAAYGETPGVTLRR